MTPRSSSRLRAIVRIGIFALAALALRPGLAASTSVELWGRAGTFGALGTATTVPSGEELVVRANDFHVSPGQSSWYGATTSDGTLFVATIMQSRNQLVATACTMEVNCFNPAAPLCRDPETGAATNLALLRIPTIGGELFAPDEACQGSPLGPDISDLAVWTSGGEERVSFLSTGLLGLAAGWPLLGEIRKIDGLWQIDVDTHLWPRDVKEATGPPLADQVCPTAPKGCCSNSECGGGTCVNAAFCAFFVQGSCQKSCTQDSDCAALGPLDYCEGGSCKRTQCGAPQEVDVLPASNRMVLAHYFGGVVVTDGRDRVLAAWDHPPVAHPCGGSGNVSVSPRQVVVDPTSAYGDERFMVAYDSGDPRGAPLQEFRYDDASQTLEPITAAFLPNIAWMPIPDCSGVDRQGSSAQYDEFGNLWVGAVQRLQTHRLLFLKDPFTGRHSATERCSRLDASGQERPWGTSCRADLGLGYWNGDLVSPAFRMPWANSVAWDRDTKTMFAASANGLIAPMPILEHLEQRAFSILPAVDLGLRFLQGIPGQRIGLSGAGPEVPLDRARRKLWISIGGTLDSTTAVEVPQWLYRADLTDILDRRPRVLFPRGSLKETAAGFRLTTSFQLIAASVPQGTTARLLVYRGATSTASAHVMERAEAGVYTKFRSSLDLELAAGGPKTVHWYAVLQGSDAARPAVVAGVHAAPPCGRTRGSFRVKGIGDALAGNESLDVSGRVELAPGVTFADLDPIAEGARLIVSRGDGTSLADIAIPGGAFAGQSGWISSAPTSQRWRFIAPSGIRYVELRPSAGGLIDVRIKGVTGLADPEGATHYRVKLHPGDGDEVDQGVCGEMRTTSCRTSSRQLSCRF